MKENMKSFEKDLLTKYREQKAFCDDNGYNNKIMYVLAEEEAVFRESGWPYDKVWPVALLKSSQNQNTIDRLREIKNEDDAKCFTTGYSIQLSYMLYAATADYFLPNKNENIIGEFLATVEQERMGGKSRSYTLDAATRFTEKAATESMILTFIETASSHSAEHAAKLLSVALIEDVQTTYDLCYKYELTDCTNNIKASLFSFQDLNSTPIYKGKIFFETAKNLPFIKEMLDGSYDKPIVSYHKSIVNQLIDIADNRGSQYLKKVAEDFIKGSIKDKAFGVAKIISQPIKIINFAVEKAEQGSNIYEKLNKEKEITTFKNIYNDIKQIELLESQKDEVGYEFVKYVQEFGSHTLTKQEIQEINDFHQKVDQYAEMIQEGY